MNKKRLLIPLLCMLAVYTCPSFLFAAEPEFPVRVCVVENADSVKLILKGHYEIYSLHSSEILKQGSYLNSKVSATKGGILVAGGELKTGGITIKTSKDSGIYIDERRFRGFIDIIRTDTSKLIVVNHLDIEKYLYGVLYHEVSHLWPMEALKAQAITARTFAVYQARKNTAQDYDLRRDIYSQVYGGRTSERWATNRAVDLTKGEVLKYRDELFPAYYHATCAGFTEDASNLWGIDIPPLKGGVCLWCGNSPHYRWSCEIPLSRINQKLNAAGYKLDGIISIGALARNKSGRIDKLEVKDSSAVTTIITAKDFRLILDPNVVRSLNFEPAIKGGDLVLKGLGWGHGAGMCQWGAHEMARKGKKTEEILKYYYPGADIAKL